MGFTYCGLNASARKMTEGAKKEEDGKKFEMAALEDSWPMKRHTLSDGTVYAEDVQKCKHVNSPGCLTKVYVFLALKDQQGQWVPESLWADEEMTKMAREYYKTEKVWEHYPRLVEEVRRDHQQQNVLVGGGHDFAHALMVSQYAILIGDEEYGGLAWVAAMCHNTDRLFKVETDEQIGARVRQYLSFHELPMLNWAYDLIVEAVMEHSKRPSPKDNPVTVILKDADKLANLEPLTLTVRSAQWQADLAPVDLVHLDQYPPGCNYRKPGSIMRDLASSLEWEGECEYEPGKKIPWFRIPKAIELAKPMFQLLRYLIDTAIQNYKVVGLIPYPFPEDFGKK